MLGLAPMVALAADFALPSVALLFLPLLAVHRGGRQAIAKEHQAVHDALTGLPNRSLFRHQIEQVVNAGRRTDRTAAVMLIDLDHFKEINDTLGHHAGDRLLQEVSERLRAVARGEPDGRPPRRRRVRRADPGPSHPRRGQRRRPAAAHPAARAVLDRGPDARGRRQHRHRLRARARLGRRAAHPARRHRDVRRQGGWPRPPAVRAAARPLQPAPPVAGRRAAIGDRRRRDHPLLPAQGRADDRPHRRRRGPGPLAAPAARPHRPVRVRADRRADRPDRPAHLARARGGAAPGARVAGQRRGAQRRRQPVRPLLPGLPARRRDPTAARADRRRGAAARARDHREHADARSRPREGDARPPELDRPQPVGRRLRHRLLVAGQPQAAAGRRHQDRQVVRDRHAARPVGRGDRALHDRPRAQPRPEGRRRGRRVTRGLAPARGARLRPRAGLPRLAAAAGRRHDAPARGAPAHRRACRRSRSSCTRSGSCTATPRSPRRAGPPTAAPRRRCRRARRTTRSRP